MKKNFAVIKIIHTFAVQYRGVEQLVARRAHNPEAGGSSPSPQLIRVVLFCCPQIPIERTARPILASTENRINGKSMLIS